MDLHLKVLNKLSNIVKSVTIVSILVAGFATSAPSVKAAGVVITATPSTVALSTATDITFTYTASTQVEASATTFTFIVANQTGGTLPGALANCTSADTQADATSGGTGSFGSFSNTGAVFTTSNATTSFGRSFCLKFPSISSADIYSVAILSSATNKDQGAALVYVGSDNKVTLTATVAPTLSFNIRNYTDTADINTCAIGTVNSSTAPNADTTIIAPGECGYALAIATNSETGMVAQIASDGKMRSGSVNIADVPAGASFVTAGTEAYGLANITPAQTGRNVATGATNLTISKGSSFSANVNPEPIIATDFVSFTSGIAYTAGTDATDTTRVIHGMSVSTSTPAGNYSKMLTYTVTANF